MPAFVRTIKAKSVTPGELFEFNRSIEYKGETLSLLKIKGRNSQAYKVKVFQDLNNDLKMTKSDIIFKGEILPGYHNSDSNQWPIDELTNFVGTVKLTKQMHSCEWDMQKEEKKRDKNMVACTRDYVPTVHELMLKSELSGVKYYALPVGKFATEDCYPLPDDSIPVNTTPLYASPVLFC